MTFSRMFRTTAILLIAVLLSNNLALAAGRTADPAAIKAKLQARGVGQGVRVSLANKEEVKGLIVAIGDRSFTLRPRKSSEAQQIDYDQVTGVHNEGMTRGQKIALTAGLVGGGIAITAAILIHGLNNSLKGPIL